MSAVAVHHVVPGADDAPVVVLPNSLGSTHAMWDAQADALAERFRVVRYDTREGGCAVAGAIVARWFTPNHLEAHPDVRADAEAMVAATPAEGYASCCEAIAAMDLRARIFRRSVPPRRRSSPT